MGLSVLLHDSPLDARAAAEDFEKSWGQLGAVASFTGYVRSDSKRSLVQQLEIDWYPGFTEASLEKIGQDVREKFQVDALRIDPRCGVIVCGDPIVFVAAASPYRWSASKMGEQLSHIDDQNRARMVDVSGKKPTVRTAVARGKLICNHKTLSLVQENRTPKGAVMSTAELAGVMAAKRTAELIPLCHPLNLTKVRVDIQIAADLPGFEILAEVKTEASTGVEMEALTTVSVAALTLYDMLKAVDKAMRIDGILVVQKTGGRSEGPLNLWQQTE